VILAYDSLRKGSDCEFDVVEIESIQVVRAGAADGGMSLPTFNREEKGEETDWDID
jgi:hypothetical protein